MKDKDEIFAEAHPELNCNRCGCWLDNGLCSDITCPFSDCPQSDLAGWQDHPVGILGALRESNSVD